MKLKTLKDLKEHKFKQLVYAEGVPDSEQEIEVSGLIYKDDLKEMAVRWVQEIDKIIKVWNERATYPKFKKLMGLLKEFGEIINWPSATVGLNDLTAWRYIIIHLTDLTEEDLKKRDWKGYSGDRTEAG